MLNNIKNYRSINLMSRIAKLFTVVIIDILGQRNENYV